MDSFTKNNLEKLIAIFVSINTALPIAMPTVLSITKSIAILIAPIKRKCDQLIGSTIIKCTKKS